MSQPKLAGIHHVKIPVTDLARSLDSYRRVFGLRVTMEFPEPDGTILGAGGEMPGLGDAMVAFRVNPQAAQGCHGFDPVSFGVQDHADIEVWASYLDSLDIPHSPVIEATTGWLLVFHDPDGIELHLYSWAEHGIDQTGRPGYGRAMS